MGKRGDVARVRAMVVSYLFSARGASTPWRIAARLVSADETLLGPEDSPETVHEARELLERFATRHARPRRVFLGATRL